ncbi:hypothetical protein [Azohydromonas aeria]|uniref:hypothetical protein n=1 Tax=Azohydromonas aeria TaxID=2590212 RepID=UPI0012FA57B6|nr:hypothetical protein [Azohydromonas aeria]
MELALIVILGGLSWWLMRPLRDWYVVEIRRGMECAGRQVFTQMEAAEQSWVESIQVLRQGDDVCEISLWHIEARSRRQALSGKLPEGREAVLLKREITQN